MNIYRDLDVSVIFMDIDGTIKDLVKENTNALISTMEKLNNVNNTARGKMVLGINKINMYLVKTGLLPTNSAMQNILLAIYSLMLFKSFNEIKVTYFNEYNKEHIFFKNSEIDLKKIYSNNLKLYFVTKNNQNSNILRSKVCKDYLKSIRLVIGKRGFTKYAVYKNFLRSRRFDKSEVVIIGDNFFDDIIPAMLLGVKVIWLDMYNCKLKRIVRKLIKVFYKNLIL